MKIFVLFFCLSAVNLPAQINFEKTYDLFQNPEMNFIQPLIEGGYVICGKCKNPVDNTSDFCFFKTDEIGNVLWSKQMTDSTMEPGIAMNESASVIREDANGNYVFGGGVQNPNYNDEGAFYGWMDKSGTLISSAVKLTTWSTSVNALLLNLNGNIISTRDDNRGLGRHKNSLEINSSSAQTISGSQSGNFSLAKQALIEMPGGGYGGIGIDDTYQWDTLYNNLPIVTRFDQMGKPIWNTIIHNEVFSGNIHFTSICATPDTGILVCGYVQNSFRTIIITKFNSEGDSLWTKSIAGNVDQYPVTIQKTKDGYAVAGNRENDILLIKLDANCNETWSKTYAGIGEDKTVYFQQTPDNGFVILANTENNGPGSIRIIKTDAFGNTANSTTQTGKVDPAGIYNLYPDPFSSSINLFVPGNQSSQFSIFDMTGRIVFSNNILGENNRIDLSFLPDGCYYTFIPGYNGLHKTKMIVKN